MSSLGVVPDLVAGFHADPLRDRSVLLLLLSEEPFDLERLVGGHGEDLPPGHHNGGSERGRRYERSEAKEAEPASLRG